MALEGGTVVIDVQARWKGGLSPGIDTADKKVDKFTASIEEAENALTMLGNKKTKFDVDDQATGKLNKFLQTTKQFAGKTFTSTVRILDYATKPLRAIKDNLFSIKSLVAGVMGGVATNQLVMNPINMADTIENTKIGFETLLGSAELAEKQIADIKEFAAKTPFDTMEVVSNVQQMLNSGWDLNNVMSDMKIIGDAAAATGNSTEGFTRIITAINQMRMSGKVNSQDMMQMTNANLPGWMIMAEGLGMTVQELRAAVQDGAVDAETGIAGLLEGLKKYEGMMDQISTRTVGGLWSNIQDTFNIKVIERWGAGLKDGAIDAFAKMADVLDVIDPHLKTLGDFLYDTGNYLSGNFTKVVDSSLGRMVELLDSEEFKNASMFGKIGLAWDKIIAEPFSEWWNSSGKKMVEEKAGQIGSGLGTGITSGLLALLGFDTVGAAGDGVDIGKSFTEGFIDGLDTEAIKDAFLKMFKDIAKDALTVLPGGESPTTSSWISALLLGGVGYKMGGGKLLGKVGSKMLGKGTWADNVGYMKWLQTNANPKGKSSLFSKLDDFKGLFGSMDDLITSGGKLGTALGKVSKVGRGVGKFAKGNWLSLLFSGAAIFSAEDKVKETAKQGAGLAGSAGGGALGAKIGGAIGTAIMPGAGTAVGAGVGGLVGSVAGYTAGEKGAGKLWDVDWEGIGESASTFFTETLPGKWDEAKESATTFFTETLPYNFGELVGGASVFFTETLPEWWGEVKTGAVTFFTETLPGWWSETKDGAVLFFTETLPEWWGEVKDNAGLFFTETLPEWWNGTVDSIATFWTETVPGYWNSAADTIASGWDGVKSYFMEKADAIGSWFGGKVEEVKTNWETFKDNFSKGKEKAEGKHANGGIFSNPHLGLVAEDGPEAIIPLGAKRRQRGIDLWKKAGAAMGVTAYADGGIVGAVSSGGGSINVGGVTVNITVDGGSGTLIDALESQSEDIKEAIAGILYDALSASFNNRPVTA